MNPAPHTLAPRFPARLRTGAAALALALGTALADGPAAPAPHWAFQPVVRPAVPAPHDASWARGPLDRFVLARLEAAGLHPNPPAGPRDWLRRVTLDLTGLPPTPAEADAFLAEHAVRPDAARERVVDRLLASPRHGERWAQHWLDVVRYADTDGFEVNTERPNAWPYRDWVVGALNADLPYDAFVRAQVAGDTLGADPATGFLVAAAALLPGQIGADDVSKRLARQDELAELVGSVGQTFMGLGVGCARCHDHKFDPIPSSDFYSLQAFFSGVRYGERPLVTPESAARRREAEGLRAQLAACESELARFEPLASDPALPAPRRTPRADRNEEVFAAEPTRFVRFTIHDANRHPTLGLIEPCIDEFEILTADDPPRNVALASAGTRVTASGSREGGSHALAHVNDGLPGNAHSWMSDEAGRGWLLFELPRPERVSRVVWSRDREGHFADRLATAFTLETGMSPDTLHARVTVPPPRPPVDPRRNTDRFHPVSTRAVRFVVESTSSLAPCLDELEVFTPGPGGKNVALASAGTRVTVSGSHAGDPQHQPGHLVDGLHGNAHSWISDTDGRGWAELEFAQEETVDRVVWSRDREGAFSDRLPTAYRIEVRDASGAWRAVASSADRAPFVPGAAKDANAGPFLAGLPPAEARQAAALLEQRRGLQARLRSAEAVPMAFAGRFEAPQPVHRLHRGDPEQPRERVAPAVLRVLGSLALPESAGDPERRRALAAWLSSPAHPLTARVMVNRVWQWHFGTGLVETPNDFGRNGARPSHPELLDWLADEFVRTGWSLKRLHRAVVLSATYGQSAVVDPAAAARDGDDRLLWRFASRRLEAEALRDGMLRVSDQLNLAAGGRGFDFFRARGGLSGFPPLESFGPEGRRRMVWAHKVRREWDAVFGAFDCPDAGQSTARRRTSTTPVQALNLFNGRFTWDTAAALAAGVRAECGADPDAGIRGLYRRVLARDPDADELADARPVVARHGLEALGRVLFNSNEFQFLP